MNDQMNAPMSPEPAGIVGWTSTWMNAVTKPNEQTFAMMAEHPDARNNTRAFTWVFLAGTISALIAGILQAVLQLGGVSPQTPGVPELFGGAEQGIAFSLGIAICTAPIAGALSILFFAIFVGIIQWVAKMFSGTGTFSKLAYTMAAISVPISLASSVLTPFSTLGVVGYCISGISLLLGLYALVLQLMAVKAVNKFGWGQAAGSYFLPLILILCICGCVAFGLASMFGLAFSDIFNQINQSLAP